MSTREAELEAEPTIAIVNDNDNTRQLLRPCIDAVHASAGSLHLQIVTIDNGSKLVQVSTGIDLQCEVQVGRNFVIDHFAPSSSAAIRGSVTTAALSVRAGRPR